MHPPPPPPCNISKKISHCPPLGEVDLLLHHVAGLISQPTDYKSYYKHSKVYGNAANAVLFWSPVSKSLPYFLGPVPILPDEDMQMDYPLCPKFERLLISNESTCQVIIMGFTLCVSSQLKETGPISKCNLVLAMLYPLRTARWV